MFSREVFSASRLISKPMITVYFYPPHTSAAKTSKEHLARMKPLDIPPFLQKDWHVAQGQVISYELAVFFQEKIAANG